MKRGKNEVFYLVDGKDGGIKITTKKPQKKEEKKKVTPKKETKKKETKVTPKKEEKKKETKVTPKKVEKKKESPLVKEVTNDYVIYRDDNARKAIQRGILRSLKWDQKLKLTILNYSSKKVDIDWINYKGKPQSYGSVKSQKKWT